MVSNADVMRVRNDIESRKGYRVKLISSKGNKKTAARFGVIEAAYSSIFTVRLDVLNMTCARRQSDSGSRRLSFRYADILTRAVELQFIIKA